MSGEVPVVQDSGSETMADEAAKQSNRTRSTANLISNDEDQTDDDVLQCRRRRSGADDLETTITGSVNTLPSDQVTTATSPRNGPNRTLGEIQGVYAPVCLSMFSSLLFLRVGYVVGNVGFMFAMIQLIICYGILVCTVCSVSAIATNGNVEGGGVYFMISRTLGPQLGGAVGVLFFAANVVSGALYASGFAETLVANFGPEGRIAMGSIPDGHWCRIGYASGVLIAVFVISIIGAKAFGKASILLLTVVTGLIGVLFVSFVGDFTHTEEFTETTLANCTTNCSYTSYNGSFYGLAYEAGSHIEKLWSEHAGMAEVKRDCSDRNAGTSFITVFGVLFAGVTGIMAGANVSGELKDPGKAIPNGTLKACLTTFIIYTVLFLLTSLTCDMVLLQHDCLYMMIVDLGHGYITLIGALVVTFCACLSALIGAARVVEALVHDTILGEWAMFFQERTSIAGNKLLGVILTFLLMFCFLLIGSLNKIAQVSSVLFLLSYMIVNFACLFLEWASAPNFRPTFKVYGIGSCFVGGLGCLVMMFVINISLAFACIGVGLAIAFFLNFTTQPRYKEWGSIGQALMFHQVRKYLLLMDIRKDHVKFWRPQILLMVSNPRYNCELIEFVNGLKKSGLYILGHVHVADFDSMIDQEDPSVTEIPHWMALNDKLKVKAFPEVTVASTVREGVRQLARISGIGAMKPNTVMLGFGGREAGDRKDCFREPHGRFESAILDNFFNCNMAPDSGTDDEKALETMNTILDMLKLDKNVCVARNFQKLNRNELPLGKSWLHNPICNLMFGKSDGGNGNGGRHRRTKIYADVWLIDFFSRSGTKLSGSASEFMMQLGTILTMSKGWNGLKLRIFVENKGDILDEMSETIKENRFPATLHPIDVHRVHSVAEEYGATVEGETDLRVDKLPMEYVVNVNDLLKAYATETAVAFHYLPIRKGSDSHKIKLYQLLKRQSDGLPPTVFVHGFKKVVSASL